MYSSMTFKGLTLATRYYIVIIIVVMKVRMPNSEVRSRLLAQKYISVSGSTAKKKGTQVDLFPKKTSLVLMYITCNLLQPTPA